MRRNLILVRAGDDSLHPQWLVGQEPREYDLCISYFGSTPDRYRSEADYYHVQPGPRWPAHYALCQEHWDWISAYDRIAFVCDDLTAPVETWNRLFRICRDYDLDIAQPAIEGHANVPITQHRPGYLLRYTNYVEVMCPVFRVSLLERLRWTLAESQSGWGLDHLWRKLLPYPDYRLAVIDAARVRHTRPAGDGTLYRVLRQGGVTPVEERDRLAAKFGIADLSTLDLRRVPAPGLRAWLTRTRDRTSRLLRKMAYHLGRLDRNA